MIETTVSYDNSAYSLERSPGEEHIVIGHVGEKGAQFVIATPSGEASAVEFNDNHESIMITRPARIIGVTRQTGIFRRFVEATADKIEQGDKVIIENEAGTRLKTKKINFIQSYQDEEQKLSA